MEHSKFEQIGDRMVFNFIKRVSNEIDLDRIDHSAEYEFQQAVQDVAKLFSIDVDYIDEDYLLNVFRLNEDLFNNSTLESKLDRPIVNEFDFDWEVTMTQTVIETYSHRISLYSDDIDEVRNVLWNMRSEGYLSPFDGEMINDEVRDSEMKDDELGDITQI